MLPLIYTKIVYTLIFGSAFLICGASEFLGPARWRGSRDAKKQDRGSLAVLNCSASLGIVLYFFLPVLFPSTTITSDQSLVFFSGLVLIFLGMCWRWYAIRTLGRYFVGIVAIHPDQQVVQHGPFKLIRHPSYSGMLAMAMGVGLMMTNWASLFALITCLLAGLLYRISVEEKVLRSNLGQPYVDYMQKTKRLIPFIF